MEKKRKKAKRHDVKLNKVFESKMTREYKKFIRESRTKAQNAQKSTPTDAVTHTHMDSISGETVLTRGVYGMRRQS